MNTATKVVLVIGAVLTLVGVVGFAVGVGGISDIEDDFNTYALEDVTNGTIEIDDSDGLGEIGLTFWVKGEYLDDSGDIGTWDICESTEITVLSTPSVNADMDPDNHNGGFYDEVNYFDSGNESNCDSEPYNKDISREDDGLVKVGRACLGCYSGDFVFESNVPVWVTYDDKIGEEVLESLGALVLGFVGGFGSLCCGVILLIIGLIMALTMKDGGQQQMMYMPPADNMMIAQQPAVQPTTTHMSQPDFGQPPQGGL